ncbi:MAG: hypothetical protein K8S13_23125 [Desulfobacula sp.]|uniref:hypothetical protein n=1 Tax=Desulfobacula sp. TaxID=2593537 RepID=UPI0025BD83C7|nr:hypothetical protein [Desulfobacula sp.]MCD4722722.1 hypothetical protein [Desulfobacula sp.]
MKRFKLLFVVFTLFLVSVSISYGSSYTVTTDLTIRAVINTVEKGAIDAVWSKGGEETTSSGDKVIWGFFYASPSDVTWGSENNPDLYVKIWFDHGGRIDVNFFHVSVPDIDVYSVYSGSSTSNQYSTTTMENRYYRHEYNSNGTSSSDYSGTWNGTWSSQYGTSGGLTINITQTGESYSGTMDIKNTDCGDVYGVSVSGTISNNIITVNASYNCDGDIATLSITYGIISGNNITGPYTQYVNGSLYDAGTFTLSK